MGIAQLEKYLKLPQNGKVIAEYVWIDGSNGIRSKCKVSRAPILLHHHTHYLHCALFFFWLRSVGRWYDVTPPAR